MKKLFSKLFVLFLTLIMLIMFIEPFFLQKSSAGPLVAKAEKEGVVGDEKSNKEPELPPNAQPGVTDLHKGVDSEGKAIYEIYEGNEGDLWTNYAEILMASTIKKNKNKKQKAQEKENNKTITEKVTGAVTAPFENKINGIIGKGGVQLEIAYSKMAAISRTIDARKNADIPDHKPSGRAGKLTASYLATFDHYNYFETVSGNKVASDGKGFISKASRLVAGGIATVGLLLFYLVNQVQDWIADAITTINPYTLFGFSSIGSVETSDNPVMKALNNVVKFLGFNKTLTYSVMALGITSITVFYTLQFLMRLPRGRVKGGLETVKNLFIRIAVIVILMTFMSLSAYAINSFLKELKHSTRIGSSTVVSHLYDVKSIASGTNLSPSGGVTTEKPTAGMEDNYIDTKFDPSISRTRMAEANKNANYILHTTSKDAQGQKKLGFELLERYMAMDNFNVNNYMADLRRSKSQTGTGVLLPGVYTYANDFSTKKEKANPQTIELSMWSATQNADSKLRDPNNKNFRAEETTGVSPGEETGVVNNSTFSTQSVALMLQSSFDGDSAKFYAYNLGPKGEQVGLKTQSTVKTEWRTVTLPGKGVVGSFASWLSMVSESISYTLVSLAVLMAIFNTNLLMGYILFIKQAFRTLFTGSVNSAMATFLLYLGTTFSTVIALYIPDVFNVLLTSISSGFANALKSYIPPAFIEILTALFLIYFAFYVGWKGRIKPMDETPVRVSCTLLTRAAMSFESKVKEMDASGGAVDFKRASKGAFKEASDKFAEVKDGTVRQVKEGIGTYTNKGVGSAKGAYMGATQGAIVGMKSGNPIRTFSGAAKGTMSGMKTGYINAEHAKDDNKLKGQVREGITNSSLMRKENGMYAGRQLKKEQHREGIRKNALNNYTKAKASDSHEYQNRDLSKTVSVPINDDAKSQYLHSERSYRTFKATQEAAYSSDNDGNPLFTGKEMRELKKSEDMESFVGNLKATQKGNQYALDTESAKEALIDSQFLDDKGNVDVEKINRFEQELDKKHASGTITDEDMKNKALIDSAFVSGASEKYISANEKETKNTNIPASPRTHTANRNQTSYNKDFIKKANKPNVKSKDSTEKIETSQSSNKKIKVNRGSQKQSQPTIDSLNQKRKQIGEHLEDGLVKKTTGLDAQKIKKVEDKRDQYVKMPFKEHLKERSRANYSRNDNNTKKNGSVKKTVTKPAKDIGSSNENKPHANGKPNVKRDKK